MSDLWYINAKLEHVGDRRIILYNMEKAQQYANPNLGDILCWCSEPCERLLEDLENKKANAKDIEFVKKEIAFLKQAEENWRTQYKKW